jgi:hypothetical protein
MAENGATCDSELPQPTLDDDGRIQLPWPYKKAGFFNVLKFLTVEPDNSNIPAAEVGLYFFKLIDVNCLISYRFYLKPYFFISLSLVRYASTFKFASQE